MTEPGAADDDKHNVEPSRSTANAASGGAAEHGDAKEPDAQSATSEPASSNIMILWPERADASDRATADDRPHEAHPARSTARRRRRLALAAVAAIAAVSGAAGGSLATLGIEQWPGTRATAQLAADTETNARLRDAVARVTADLGAMRTDFDRANHARTNQMAKLGDRLDKVEKSQDETSTRLTKLGETQEKLQEKAQDRQRAAAASSAADITGSISSTTAKGDLLKTPQVIDGWTLTRVTNGGAIVSGPDGLYEAYPGDPLPGIGRVDAVRYQDGRWAVITPKGIIVRR